MNNSPSAYRLAPWRKQMQKIFTIVLVILVIALVVLFYLNISERMTDAKLRIQVLQEERSDYSRKIADLTTDEGRLTSYKKMQERAEKAGFVEIDFNDDTEYEYVIIDGYTGTGINSNSEKQEEASPVVSLIKPEYTESFQEWLAKQISTGIASYEMDN